MPIEDAGTLRDKALNLHGQAGRALDGGQELTMEALRLEAEANALEEADAAAAATWKRYEALRDAYGEAEAARAALDAFVREMLTKPTQAEGGGQGRPMCPRDLDELDGLAHELWASAQLVPGEGILHGVYRIIEVLAREYGVIEAPRR